MPSRGPARSTYSEMHRGIAHRCESGYHPHPESVNSEDQLPGPAQNTSARIACRWLLWMRLIAVVLLASLVLAASADASTGIDPAVTEGSVEVAPVGTVVEEVVQTVPEAPPPVTVESPEATPVLPEAESAEATPVPPVIEEATEATPVPPVIEEVAEAAPAPPVVEEIPEAASAGPPPPEPVPLTPVAEESPSAAVEQKSSEASPSGGHSEESPKGAASLTPPAASTPSGSDPGVEAASVLVASAATPAVGDPGETWAIAGARTPPGPPPGATAAQFAASVGCRLSVLNAPITSCTTGWLGAQGLFQRGPVSLSTAVSWPAQGKLAPSEGDHEDSAGATRPATPTPGPTPGGASPSAAVGGSGIALSAFLTLTGLLLLAAPRAMRRLRLSCEPWLTAFFVLIPERPG
jgi:outer membrane biosynthesis protein TonB